MSNNTLVRPSSSSVAISSNGKSAAIALANKIGHDAWLEYHFAEFADASDAVKVGGARIYMDLVRILSPEDLASMPVPGTTKFYEDAAGNQVARNTFDKWDEVIDGKKVTYSYYKILAESTPQGQQLMANRDNFRKLRDGNLQAVPEDFVKENNSADKIGTGLKKAENRVNNYKTLLTRAASLWQQINRINTELGANVSARVMKRKIMVPEKQSDGTVVDVMVEDVIDSPACIRIAEKTAEGEGRSICVTIGQCLAYSIEKALVKGGTYDALMLSTAKEKKAKGNKTEDGTLVPVIETPDVATEYFDELAAYVQDTNKFRAFLSHLTKLEQKEPEEFKDVLLSIGAIVYGLDSYMTKHQNQYDALVETGGRADIKSANVA
jgi:hypothetical protein